MEEEEKHIIVKYSYPGWTRVGDSKITFVSQNETVHLFTRFDAFFNPLEKKILNYLVRKTTSTKDISTLIL